MSAGALMARGRLPAAAPRLISREAELRDIRQLLLEDDVRLVTLARAEELYISLVATDALDHRLWEALARLHGARNDLLGLEATFRRLRRALVELGEGDDPDRVPIPPTLKRVFDEVRASLMAGRD